MSSVSTLSRNRQSGSTLDEIRKGNPIMREIGGAKESDSNGKTTAAPEIKQLKVDQLQISLMEITLIGDSPLIVNRWSEKAKQEMRDKQTGAGKQKKPPKDPQKCYEDSLYKIGKNQYGFPAIGFKAAAVDACSQLDKNMTKVQTRGAFHIRGDMVLINGQPKMREDMVKISMGTADLRYRGEFSEWKATITIRYNKNVFTPDQIINLFDTAGFAVGIGEWRPARDGAYGMFHVDPHSIKLLGSERNSK